MTKRFALTPDLTCPELEGYKLPEIPSRYVDNLGKDLTAYINEKHTQEECIGFVDGYSKAREKYEFTLADIRKAFLAGIEITGEGGNGEYCNGNSPDIEHEFGKDADIYIESITRIPIAIEVEMVEVYLLSTDSCAKVPDTHPDGTVKGVWVYE